MLPIGAESPSQHRGYAWDRDGLVACVRTCECRRDYACVTMCYVLCKHKVHTWWGQVGMDEDGPVTCSPDRVVGSYTCLF